MKSKHLNEPRDAIANATLVAAYNALNDTGDVVWNVIRDATRVSIVNVTDESTSDSTLNATHEFLNEI